MFFLLLYHKNSFLTNIELIVLGRRTHSEYMVTESLHLHKQVIVFLSHAALKSSGRRRAETTKFQFIDHTHLSVTNDTSAATRPDTDTAGQPDNHRSREVETNSLGWIVSPAAGLGTPAASSSFPSVPHFLHQGWSQHSR